MHIVQYSSADRATWNDFVGSSKNGTFLFNRDYLEYHGGKYEDFSFIVRDDDGAVAALLPAHRDGSRLVSHSGLTYGGLITDESMKLPKMLETFQALFEYLHSVHLTTLYYKTMPRIYHRIPAEEDLYALYIADAQIVQRRAMAVLQPGCRPLFQQRRRRGAKKATQSGVTIIQTERWAEYWDLLIDRLEKAHSASPVHALEEIVALADRFPSNIKLFGALLDDQLVAGVVIHESHEVARAQYIAANDVGQTVGALDLLFSRLLSQEYVGKRFFDFGTSHLKNDRGVSRGLIDQKEGYGARLVMHDHYELDVAHCASVTFSNALR